jgi:hypothetical protein
LEAWLAHPAMQAGVLPFVVALVVAFVLARSRWLAVAQEAGFAVAVTLAAGWSLDSLTSTRKLAIVGIAVIALCAAVEWKPMQWRRIAAGVCAVLAAATVWMLWRLLAQKDTGPALWAAIPAAGYVALQAGLALHCGEDPVRSAASGAVLGLATGIVAILGASALLGTFALAVGSAAAATLAVQFFRGSEARVGRSISLPAAAVAALAGVNGVMTGELPWYALLPLLLIAPVARLAPATLTTRIRCIAAFALCLIPAAAAIALAWFRPA